MNITYPATLASGAGQLREQSELTVYRLAREFDRKGSGQVDLAELAQACEELWCERQLRRILRGPKAARYWRHGGDRLFLRAEAKVAQSMADEPALHVFRSATALTFPLRDLTTRPARDAAIAAAVLCCHEPRSYLFALRFAGVDRKTLAAWQKDPIISRSILGRLSLPVLGSSADVPPSRNRWETEGLRARASVRIQKAVTRPRDAGAPVLLRAYYRDVRHLKETIRKHRRAGGDIEADLRRLASVFIENGRGYDQLPASEVIHAFVRPDISPQLPDTLPLHLRDSATGAREGRPGGGEMSSSHLPAAGAPEGKRGGRPASREEPQ